ncbi:MAG: NADP-dependent malic enzyme [Bacteroidota bacterium]
MSITKIRPKDALDYHENKPAGKIEVNSTKPVGSQQDLALAYSPGVAEPCKVIAEDKESVYRFTAKGNLVGVISNGTAVLGLGNIGPEASKPVMEGKGVLFKKFAGIDVFDIEIDEQDPDKFIEIVQSLEPTFGGINLEDIKAPESFKIEQTLRENMDIPVMHDDQHGTAIISSSALLNALEIVGKKIEDLKIVVSGAGAAAIACTDLYVSLGAKKENILMADSKGILNKKREGLDEIKSKYVTDHDVDTLAEAMKGADVFLGLSIADIVSAEMLRSMTNDPIVFALSNPDPEISYELAVKTRKDVIMATGRSDHPNQVNNVLGFPYIFRGALDVRSTSINEEMKLAAVKAIAALAKEQVPDIVLKAYGKANLKFGPEYLIPKPIDPRLITTISPAVAKAAMETGVARIQIKDWVQYEHELLAKVGIDQRLISRFVYQARQNPKKVVFAEANHINILKAAQLTLDSGIGIPILMGNKHEIKELIKENDLDAICDCQIVDPEDAIEKLELFAAEYMKMRQRKGMTMHLARKVMADRTYFGMMMVEKGEADVLISGLSNDYPKTILPALQIIGMEKGVNRVAGVYIVNTAKGNFFFADASVNLNPSAEELVEIIGLTNRAVQFFDYEPKMAVLSYSNFGSAKGAVPEKVAKAVKIAKEKYPELKIDGDLQANVALNKTLRDELYPFNDLKGENVNTLIFPDLQSGNIAYKIMMEIGGAEVIGPVLMGMKKSVQVLQLGSSVREIYNMVAIAVVDAGIQQGELL